MLKVNLPTKKEVKNIFGKNRNRVEGGGARVVCKETKFPVSIFRAIPQRRGDVILRQGNIVFLFGLMGSKEGRRGTMGKKIKIQKIQKTFSTSLRIQIWINGVQEMGPNVTSAFHLMN